MSSKKGADNGRHPWRDNLEALTIAVLLTVFLKYFIVEAYRIPSGSMQPTLMGFDDDEGQALLHDRILVDKLSFHFRDPERFEVVVFRFPLDQSRSFVKRLWGMPGDHLRIRGGDVWLQESSGEWRVLRRPLPVQRDAWRRLAVTEWELEQGATPWRAHDGTLIAPGPGSASFPPAGQSVRNSYTDGYPSKIADYLAARTTRGCDHDVGDLRIELTAQPDPECRELRIAFREGVRRYELTLPGPAGADAPPSIELSGHEPDARTTRASGSSPVRWPASGLLQVAAENLDDRVQLEIEGEVVLSVDIESVRDQRSAVTLALEGGGARLSDLRVYRDVYYTTELGKAPEWEVPEQSYLMLGDNTIDSADSREWKRMGFHLRGGELAGTKIWGNDFPTQNPQYGGDPRADGGSGGLLTFFRDEYGERHVLASRENLRLPPEPAPFVPRRMIAGRALLVFWPYVPSLDVYRLRWIR